MVASIFHKSFILIKKKHLVRPSDVLVKENLYESFGCRCLMEKFKWWNFNLRCINFTANRFTRDDTATSRR